MRKVNKSAQRGRVDVCLVEYGAVFRTPVIGRIKMSDKAQRFCFLHFFPFGTEEGWDSRSRRRVPSQDSRQINPPLRKSIDTISFFFFSTEYFRPQAVPGLTVNSFFFFMLIITRRGLFPDSLGLLTDYLLTAGCFAVDVTVETYGKSIDEHRLPGETRP